MVHSGRLWRAALFSCCLLFAGLPLLLAADPVDLGSVAKIAFDIGWLSQVFAAGHRIRVTIASTGAPFYEPNPNTGEPLTIEFPATVAVAKNTVQVNRHHASRIIAPVVP